jgi:hypothetical protein
MSKRLNKRQQRELEELEQLKAQHDDVKPLSEDEPEEEGELEADEGPVNPFAAVS